MKRLVTVLLGVALCGLVLGGCKKKEEPAAAPAPTGEAQKEETPPAEPPAKEEPKAEPAKAPEGQPAAAEPAKAPEGQPAAEPAKAPEGGDSIGVPECDEFIAKYSKCVSEKVPEAQRATFEQGMKTMKDGWKQAAATEAGKGALGTACKQALETSKQALSAFGCEM